MLIMRGHNPHSWVQCIWTHTDS